jgi:hypothetical protein
MAEAVSPALSRPDMPRRRFFRRQSSLGYLSRFLKGDKPADLPVQTRRVVIRLPPHGHLGSGALLIQDRALLGLHILHSIEEFGLYSLPRHGRPLSAQSGLVGQQAYSPLIHDRDRQSDRQHRKIGELFWISLIHTILTFLEIHGS